MKRMVTRTIKLAEIEAMTVDVTTASVEIKTFKISEGGIKTTSELLKELKTKFETETIKIVNIENVKTTETLYGMDEEEFIKLAMVLPPR